MRSFAQPQTKSKQVKVSRPRTTDLLSIENLPVSVSQTTSNHVIQRFAAVSSPGDTLEKEADAVADRVFRMPGPRREEMRPDSLPGTPATHTELPNLVADAIRSPGNALDPSTRAFMESRFGHDFGSVRIHTDGAAATSANELSAIAYTIGSDVVFGAGAYSPRSERGRALLAHELTHVVQQTGGVPLGSSLGGPAQVSAVPAGLVQRQSAGGLASLLLGEIQCIAPDDLGGDEVYITVGGRRIWGPVSMDTFDVRSINIDVPFSGTALTIRVFDEEPWPFSDDEIGSVTINTPSSEEEIRRAPSSAYLTTHGAYQLYFSVHRV